MKIRITAALLGLFALVGSMLFSTFAVAQSACTRTYGGGCPSCAGIAQGRTYVNIAPFGCTVCNSFCKINLPLKDEDAAMIASPEVQEAPTAVAPTDERLFLKIRPQLIASVAIKSPDIAQAAKIVAEYSERLDTPMPTQGHTRFEKIFTTAAVSASLAGSDVATITSLVKDIPKPADFSFVTWELRKRSGGGKLVMTHRLMNEKNVEIAKNQPDVEFDVKWIKSGSGGYWEARSWRPANENN